ncbi:DNA mismatch repair protein MutS [Sphingobacterium spiritivorum]|uniref:MutS domain V protein n=1 Tax=Sphingobacterium spiritivorum ATCC 33861 TaxID=525373 RepID=D7VJ66_SPHSI|nr:DNA mismatch repair protein MutS [Sphingobacterium spiritivorum]EFK58919.1 MutS domain V protein [Sphingobacterium spiritivorum ATCC 33861]QQT36781.1 DNA mismatch repair protein MutS [Sphingobacterium spiritivorum]WQD33537.1 DNA mismatch repair protein MutS [Sphingobacterium spiritivorum]SUJ24890.1 DNA mismatch repair protein mutS [Sphingobacterium spiritivorum]
MDTSIYSTYANAVEQTKVATQILDKKINSNSFGRLAVILGGGGLLFWSFQQKQIWLVSLLFALIILLFAFLIRRQSRLEKERDNLKAFLRVNENEILLRDQRINCYSEGQEFEDGRHPYLSDLDIFGRYSLFTLVNRAATKLGIQQLAKWLSAPADKEIIQQRQDAVKELSAELHWCQQLQTTLIFNLDQQIEVKAFLRKYFQSGDFSFGNAFMRIYVTIVPFVMLAGIILALSGVKVIGYVFILALVHIFWTLAMAGRVSVFSSKIDKVGGILNAYADGIRLVEERQWSSALTNSLQQRVSVQGNKGKLSAAFKELGGLINKLDARNNILVGTVLNMFLLWDFKQVMAIVKWKSRYEENILEAFDVIAEYEALLSFATLKRNYPDWAFPVILEDTKQNKITGEAINHPLINEAYAVANNYDANEHRIALVTGSNMAGKSTFLRTIGINAVLAYSGAPVCASSLELPIYKLITYMRIKDNLNESTSTFKAELDRMKYILDTVYQDKDSFFLIDEMLRGTNSVDKYLGSRAIIKKLISMDGKGMVATHDLQLSTLEAEYPGIVRNYHFDIQVKEGEMLFDYKLKDGECKVFNASMLLKGIGVEIEN